MKIVKTTLLLIAILLLTVSGVAPEATSSEMQNTYKESSTPIDVLVHRKDKIKAPSHG